MVRTELLLSEIPLLQPVRTEGRLSLAKSATAVTFATDGEVVMREGDAGESMFIVTAGTAVVSIEGAGEVARKTRGDWFGEMALMNDAARSATITVSGSLECLEITRGAFDEHVFGAIERPHSQTELLLTQVPLLSSLQPEQRSQLAANVEVEKFKEGDVIMRQHAPGECMYVIERGTASVSIEMTIIAELEEGQFFGEQALLNDAPRTATIRATSEGGVRCLKLSR